MTPLLRRCAGAVLGMGHFLGRNRAMSRLGRHVTWYLMCGFINAMNHDMSRNGERWLIKRFSADLRGRSVIDVGANAGNWSALVLDASPTSKVYAVEMIPSFAANVRQRFAERVEVLEVALSDRREPATALKLGGGGRMFRGLDREKREERFELETRTGDDLALELDLKDISLIKIDVDGYDMKVMRGFSSVIREQRPIVQFEYSRFYIFSRSFLKDAYDFFTPLNYHVGRVMPRWIEFSEYRTSMEIFATNNYVAIPDERWPGLSSVTASNR